MHPQYRTPRNLETVLRKVQAGLDSFITEKYQDQIAAALSEWSCQLLESPQKTIALEKMMSANFTGTSPKEITSQPVRATPALKIWKMEFAREAFLGRENFLGEWRRSLESFSKLATAEFQVTSIRAGSSRVSLTGIPDLLETSVRFEMAGTGVDFYREQRAGNWELEWEALSSGEFRLRNWRMLDEVRSRSSAPVFVDVASQCFGGNPSYASQLLHGTDYWRTVLDGACGIDIYGHNGVSVGGYRWRRV